MTTIRVLTEADANWLTMQDPDTGRALAAVIFGGTPTRTRVWAEQISGWWYAPAILVTAPCDELRPEQGSGHPPLETPGSLSPQSHPGVSR